MSFAWPWALAALLAVPLLPTVRWWLARRRRRTAVRVSSLALIRAAMPGRSGWRRRIPVVLFLAGLISVGLGTARPLASVPVPANSASILLALDVSLSMCSTDVEPNRLTVARDAARQFITSQEEGTRIGLVAFSGVAGLLVEPTTDQAELLAALDNLDTARGTAIGMAVLTAIDAIAETNPAVPPTGVDLDPGAPLPGVDGDYQPDTIVVLTDGANSQGVDPITAAEQAAARKLRVYTIGFGTTEPAPMVCRADQIGAGEAFGGDGRFGGGRFGGGRLLRIDEASLSEMARLTGGEYYRAEDADQLVDVLLDLPDAIVVQQEEIELAGWFALVGALLTAAAVALSLWWNRALSAPVRSTPVRPPTPP
ncbi:VWA domain-containing protein [Solwaraspora sp. WMMD1047]|uniref:VWA domain-containing protein n=1 Tax=Solwaraspora sp. WMMD1047 TaxID=3016102 RepID=UPI0024165387|nr:VWA domain-containing protein [Solwaraspora sp. WMMD1047]MDG4830996.1 VWA domain-containing protein [Solwaraspora sp. WMMD1047]